MTSCIGSIKIFAASANPNIAKDIAGHLGLELGKSETGIFSDGEINVRVLETVRGADVFIIQSTSPPVNDHLMELLIMIDAMKRSSAGRITAVIPYFGYARQDRRARSHDPISAKLVADLITTAGADRVLCMDLHAPQIQGFFNLPVDHLRGIYKFEDYIKKQFENYKEDVAVVSPDLGSVARCNSLADSLDVPLAIVDKRRPRDNITEVANFIGDVKGKIAILLDDVLSTGGSLCNAAASVMEHGAKEVHACVTHPVLAEDSIDLIAKSDLKSVVMLNTIEVPEEKHHEKIEILDISKFLAKCINCIHLGQSIGDLYKINM